MRFPSPAVFPTIAACGLALALGGCAAAVPQAHMGASTSRAAPACATGTDCGTTMAGLSFSDMVRQFDETLPTVTRIKADDLMAMPDPGAK